MSEDTQDCGDRAVSKEEKHLEALAQIANALPEFKNFVRAMSEKEFVEVARPFHKILN